MSFIMVVALLIPSSVLKHSVINWMKKMLKSCSPPNTVIGIETLYMLSSERHPYGVVALLIPSSVLKLETIIASETDPVPVVALLIPSSVLKPQSSSHSASGGDSVVALLIPSSVYA